MNPVRLLLFAVCAIATPAGATVVPQLWSENSVKVVTNATQNWPWLSYITAPDLTPAYLQINTTGETLQPGHLLYTPAPGVSTGFVPQRGPIISTDTGETVWVGPEAPTSDNFRVQTLFGEQVLTWWTGTGNAAAGSVAGHGYGQINIYNASYEPIYTICPQLNTTIEPGAVSECDADVHESLITAQDTILITVYNITTTDLTSVGGPESGYIFDCLVLEIDIRTNKTLFSWSAIDHVPVNASHVPIGSAGNNASDAYDYFHVNAIYPFEGGLLINSRHTWTTYYVDANGDIVWSINGADGGDFGSLPAGGNFAWQHNSQIRRVSSTEVSMTWFNNDNYIAGTRNVSTGVELAVTLPPDPSSPPRLVANVSSPAYQINTSAEGSHTVFTNGDRLLGYGIQPVFHYFTASGTEGELIWSARFNYDNVGSSYRLWKQDWHAVPSSDPVLVVNTVNATATNLPLGTSEFFASGLRGYVSWNGATDVLYYNVYAGNGSSTTNLSLVGVVSRRGFETEIYLPSTGRTNLAWQVGAVYNTSSDSLAVAERRSNIVAVRA